MAQRGALEIEVGKLARSRQWLEAALAFIARYREASIAAVAVLLVAYIQINNSVFLSSSLMSVVLRDTARIGLISVGIVLVMITGEIDLSVGATFAMAPYLMIRMSTAWGLSLWVTAPIAILLGVAVGFVNGFITVKLRIPALITTLGTFFLLTGLTVSFAHSQPIQMPVQQPFNLVFGLHVISTGSNLLAAREIGVRTDRMKIAAFMILGGLASLTGLITATVSGSAAPDAGGSNLTLLAIAAAVIGGTALTGGSGTVIGALIGAFVIACLNNGLVLLGAQATESNIYLGAAILAAMILNVQVDAVRVRRKR